MFDDLLPYYNSELRHFRENAKAFAAAHPKIAGRLRVSQDAVEDPHVGRLVEAFAFLTGRVRMKLDDDFPELTSALLGLLHPHYLAPIPSLGIVEFTPQKGLAGSATVPARTAVLTEPVDGEVCEFRTGYPVELWPVEIRQAAFSGLPLAAPFNPRAAHAQGVLRITLGCTEPGQTFTQLGLDRLRFHIHSEARTAQALYELLLSGVVSIALAESAVDPEPIFLDPSAIRPVGFARDETLLPLMAGSEAGYVQLSEFFAFPEKFMFFDLTGLSAKILRGAGSTLEVFVYVDRHDPSLESLVGASDLRLFCTPMINLFPARADPIRIDPGRFEHRIIPDARRESSLEVYSVEKVVVTDRDGEVKPFRPFFSLGQRLAGGEPVTRFWHSGRRPSSGEGGGDDAFLTFVDESGSGLERDLVASIDILATNRNLPELLPFGNERPALRIGHEGGVGRCRCLAAPTRAIRRKPGPTNHWRLISHLSLAQLSVSEPRLAADLVREMLALYDHADAAGGRAIIERLTSVTTRPAVARAPGGGRIAFTSGVDVEVEFDDHRLSGSGAFLLGAVLEAVFASLSAINAFTRTYLRLKGDKGFWHAWPARTGTRSLI